ncbi:homeobox-leucine zipper protein HAT3-like [Rhododendron vialii]|uniref:homeobox-leucine zipper protein HAT3-like n=1 Tax=Rhododendron vialii TaxID=182163 RepID=UPI00265F9C6E|nr:homeobox-leucine zipper protein HAT3-like [Rhododendron vialii]
MGEKDDGLGLSLSFKCPEQENPPPPPPPPPPFPLNLHSMFQHHNKPSLTAFQPSPEARSYLRGFDINRSAAECEEEAGVSSPNSTISSVSGKRSEREEAAERGWGSTDGGGGDEDDDGGETARKKLRLSREQSAVLEETFKEHTTLNPKHKVALAKQLNLRPRQVEVWFQNRRARTKLKQTEVDCEYLKRCCENLTEENRRLQKEVNELRTLKLSPQSYMNMNPPTTLTMCPSCERVAVRPPPSSAPASTAPPATSANSIAGHLKPSGPQHQRSYAHNPGP